MKNVFVNDTRLGLLISLSLQPNLEESYELFFNHELILFQLL